MAYYHITAPSYASNYSQLVKVGIFGTQLVHSHPYIYNVFVLWPGSKSSRAWTSSAERELYSICPLQLTNHFIHPIGLQAGSTQRTPKAVQSFCPIPQKTWCVSRLAPSSVSALTKNIAQAGSGWAYGVRVVSTVDDEAADRKSVSSRSSSSPYKDYEIRRRWDDCLWFQETLELEYSIQAREKRRRLEQGKGVKKNGVYLDSKQAASFDSLPPGPDPTSVSLDIHDYIPKLSKKATLFRVNQATIDQRQQQFTSLINAFFAPQVPTLIDELRRTRTFRDFFGWWRRDKDFAHKHGPDKGKGPQVPTFGSIPFYLDNSNSSQVFSDTTSSSQDLPSPRSRSTRPSTADATTPDFIRRSPHNRSREDVSSRRRRTISAAIPSTPVITISGVSTNGSHESRPSSRASLYSALSGEMSPTMVMWDGQEQLNASDRVSPHALLNAFPQTPMVRETFENIQCPPSPEADSPILGLEALPEESELELPLSQMSGHGHEPETRSPLTRSRGNSASDSRHRNAIIISPEIALGNGEIPDRLPTMTSTTTVAASPRHSSLFSNASFAPSRRTSTSDLPPCLSPRRSLDSCTTDTVDYSSSSPVTPPTPWLSDHEALAILGPSVKRNRRESTMSIDSVMTDASVDQVLPRSTPHPGDSSAIRSFSPGPRGRPLRFVPMSVPEEEGYLEDCDDGVLESYLYGKCQIHCIPHSISETSILPSKVFLTPFFFTL